MQRRDFLSTAGALLTAIFVARPAAVRQEAGDWSREHFNRRRFYVAYKTNQDRLHVWDDPSRIGNYARP